MNKPILMDSKSFARNAIMNILDLLDELNKCMEDEDCTPLHLISRFGSIMQECDKASTLISYIE